MLASASWEGFTNWPSNGYDAAIQPACHKPSVHSLPCLWCSNCCPSSCHFLLSYQFNTSRHFLPSYHSPLDLHRAPMPASLPDQAESDLVLPRGSLLLILQTAVFVRHNHQRNKSSLSHGWVHGCAWVFLSLSVRVFPATGGSYASPPPCVSRCIASYRSLILGLHGLGAVSCCEPPPGGSSDP